MQPNSGLKIGYFVFKKVIRRIRVDMVDIEVDIINDVVGRFS